MMMANVTSLFSAALWQVTERSSISLFLKLSSGAAAQERTPHRQAKQDE